jgi:hypothetical protein
MVPHSSAWEGADRRQSKNPVITYGTYILRTTNTMEYKNDASFAAMNKRTGYTSYRAGH